MMEPESGRMHPLLEAEELKKQAIEALALGDTFRQRALLDAAKAMERGESVNAETLESIPKNAVLFREGEEIEVRGCWFRVDAVRCTRITLTPIARPK